MGDVAGGAEDAVAGRRAWSRCSARCARCWRRRSASWPAPSPRPGSSRRPCPPTRRTPRAGRAASSTNASRARTRTRGGWAMALSLPRRGSAQRDGAEVGTTGRVAVTGPRAGDDRLAARAGRSRRAGRPAAGRSTGAPLSAAASAGAAPAHAKTSSSSPLRNRWQRTPPVARPLAGYSENGVTFTDPASVPGSAEADPETVTTTRSLRLERGERDHPGTRARA